MLSTRNFFAKCAQATFRPYDIGDRIVIAGNPGDDNKGVAASWFVEGRNLREVNLVMVSTCTYAWVAPNVGQLSILRRHLIVQHNPKVCCDR
jgi:hypothetical protein